MLPNMCFKFVSEAWFVYKPCSRGRMGCYFFDTLSLLKKAFLLTSVFKINSFDLSLFVYRLGMCLECILASFLEVDLKSVFFGISAQNDAELWSSCRKRMGFCIDF